MGNRRQFSRCRPISPTDRTQINGAVLAAAYAAASAAGYTDFFPSAQARYELQTDLIARLAIFSCRSASTKF
ncbi:MAG: hypothetical protein NVS9B2_20910 [Steroidobacteraceae bacterium]